ncbi:MAG: protein-L-isoaspartate O-methyltransferase [Deltaproteobacteria bacterium]|nr:MAG: protein-L-isoaspartate O-methyltransferase [Deltaproteobacteria bacterium]
MVRLVEDIAAKLGVTDRRVIEAVASVPRHWFVDEALRLRAYSDDALPIGYGQTISKVSTVLRMTALLNPQRGEKVLEIGTGSGFQAAVLARLADSVYSVERVGALALRAREMLNSLRAYRVHIRTGDGSKGWAKHAPYDKIIVTAAADRMPHALLEQLAHGGLLVTPVAGSSGQVLKEVRRLDDDNWEEVALEACRFVPLVEGSTAR